GCRPDGHRCDRAPPRPCGPESTSPRGRHVACDAAESNVRGRTVDRLGLSCGRPVTAAVAGSTQMRAALDDAARHADRRLARIEAVGGTRIARIAGHTRGLHSRCRMPGSVEVRRPLPDVTDHVIQAVAVWRETAHRRRALESVERGVLMRELSLPGV